MWQQMKTTFCLQMKIDANHSYKHNQMINISKRQPHKIKRSDK